MCPPRPLEPGGHAAELVVLLEQQAPMAAARQRVGGGHAGQAAADDDAVVLVANALEEIFGHGAISSSLVCADRCSIGHRDAAEVIAPMMPTKPWSVPQMNRFFEVRRAVGAFAGAP